MSKYPSHEQKVTELWPLDGDVHARNFNSLILRTYRGYYVLTPVRRYEFYLRVVENEYFTNERSDREDIKSIQGIFKPPVYNFFIVVNSLVPI